MFWTPRGAGPLAVLEEGRKLSFRVAVAKCSSYDNQEVRAAVEALLEALPGAIAGLKPGARAFLKPNLLSARPPELCVTTHPAVVGAVAAALRQRGLGVVIGDSPGGPFTRPLLERLYDVTGMTAAAALSGAELNFDTAATEVSATGLPVPRRLCLLKPAVEADLLANVCKVKTHGLTGLTAAVKNLFGCVPGILKTEYHMNQPTVESFSETLADIARQLSPGLNVADAVLAMEGPGPSHGRPKHVGLLLASADPFALDYALAGLFGLAEEDFTTLAASLRRGYGPRTDSELEVVLAGGSGGGEGATAAIGDRGLALLRELGPASFELLRPENLSGLHGRGMVARVLRRIQPWLRSRPEVLAARCSACGTCVRHCPARALALKSGRPVVDLRRCIRCFCCQELCPRGAVRIARPWGSRLIYRRAGAGRRPDAPPRPPGD